MSNYGGGRVRFNDFKHVTRFAFRVRQRHRLWPFSNKILEPFTTCKTNTKSILLESNDVREGAPSPSFTIAHLLLNFSSSWLGPLNAHTDLIDLMISSREERSMGERAKYSEKEK